eukprot:TRINITY_DN1110_c0_g1_i1.p1 TRINITY_DN1110_c0_g1~~TRINITY_DN1110_c0_g1_i1.p1  ORF type:complete len:295 (-),score=57.26 TRINITY_DN1110_c0_g1_i1:7-891(-)
MRRISSPTNSVIRMVEKLRDSSEERAKTATFFAHGDGAYHKSVDLRTSKRIFVSEEDAEHFSSSYPTLPPSHFHLISPQLLKRLCLLETLPKNYIAAEYPLRPPTDMMKLNSLPRLLLLENVRDPGNLGTLLRSALALGWRWVYLLPHCCDPFNEKVLRASRGASPHLHFQKGDWSQAQTLIQKKKMSCLISATKGGEDFQNVQTDNEKESFALVLGNEAHGVSEDTMKLPLPRRRIVTIPTSPNMDSLNVAIAGSILMARWPNTNFADSKNQPYQSRKETKPLLNLKTNDQNN